MAESYEKQISNIIMENKLYHYTTELQHTENEKQKNDILNIIAQLNNQNKTGEENAREEIEKICKATDNKQRKKKWTYLNEDYKEEKIKEYVSKNNLDDKLDEIIDLLRNKKLKGKKIVYNVETGIIEKINI